STSAARAGNGSPCPTWTATTSASSGAPPRPCCATSTGSWRRDPPFGGRARAGPCSGCLYHAGMSFFAILFALLIEQVRPLGPHNMIHSNLRAWARWVSRNFDAGARHHGWVVWALTVLAPSLGALGVYWALLLLLGWPFAVLWNVMVLYLTLGF